MADAQSFTLGDNVVATKEGNSVVIRIDLSKSLGRSKSGKSDMVASTGGNVLIPGTSGIKIGVNAYKPV
jgi:hypothetical protein